MFDPGVLIDERHEVEGSLGGAGSHEDVPDLVLDLVEGPWLADVLRHDRPDRRSLT